MHKKIAPFPCAVSGCQAVLRSRLSLDFHHARIHRVHCSFAGCGALLKDERGLQAHIEANHSVLQHVPMDERTIILSNSIGSSAHGNMQGSFTCPAAVQNSFEMSTEARVQVGGAANAQHSQSRFVCNKGCGDSFYSRRDRKMHVLTLHKKITPFPCAVSGCQAVLQSRHALDLHHGKMHRVPCTVTGCSAALKNGRQLQTHVQTTHSVPRLTSVSAIQKKRTHVCICPRWGS